MTDHDQRLKTVLKEFFPEFFDAYFPEWAERFDFSTVEWLDKEVFADPPQGQRRVLDLVARLRTRYVVEPQRPGDLTDDWITLIHIEVESAESIASLRSRMYEYYEILRRSHHRPVLPIALLLRVGLEGIGRDAFEERFWDWPVLRFEYQYVGLPALDAEAHVASGNVLDAALSSLMREPEPRKVWLRAEALRRIMESGENNWRKYLLGELVQAYLPLDEPQQAEFDHLITQEPFMAVQQYGTTWFEQGQIQGQRKLLTRMLEARFGPLSDTARARLEALSSEDLDQLGIALLTAKSLQELGLEA